MKKFQWCATPQHKGPCLINGQRPDGSTGPVCMNCGRSMDESDRRKLNNRHRTVSELVKVAGARSRTQ